MENRAENVLLVLTGAVSEVTLIKRTDIFPVISIEISRKWTISAGKDNVEPGEGIRKIPGEEESEGKNDDTAAVGPVTTSPAGKSY